MHTSAGNKVVNFRRNNESIQDLSMHRTSSPDSIDSNLSDLNIDGEQSTSASNLFDSTDSDENNASSGNNNNNLLMKNSVGRMPFATPTLLPPLPPQFQFGAGMINPLAQKNPAIPMPSQMGVEAMQQLFMSPLFQHFQKQFVMQQQFFAQQQFMMQQKQSDQSKSSTESPKTIAQKRNKLSIDEILKQRVKPTQVTPTEQQEDHPTDTSGSNNGIVEEDEAEDIANKLEKELDS